MGEETCQQQQSTEHSRQEIFEEYMTGTDAWRKWNPPYGPTVIEEDGWHQSRANELTAVPPCLPQCSWQTYSAPEQAQTSLVFRRYTTGPDGPESISPRKPVIKPPLQCGPAPRRFSVRRTDNELFTCFDEDTSSLRDGCASGRIAASILSTTASNTLVAQFRKAAEKKKDVDSAVSFQV